MKRPLMCAGVAIATVLGAVPLRAQGSAVQTHSSCATAMGAAGVASPCDDGSAVLFNPAAIALQRGVVGAGWTGVTTGGGFTYHGTGEQITREDATSSVPFGFATYRPNDRWAVGIGAFAPYGLHIYWPEEFEGRYVSHDTELRNIYVQPTIAYQVTPDIAVGAGVDVVFASIELNQYLDLANLATGQTGPTGAPVTFGALGIVPGTDVAEANLAGNGVGVGFHVAATARLNDMVSVGARYMHSVNVGYEGDADFRQINTGLLVPASTPAHPLNPTGAPLQLDTFLGAALFGEGRPLSDQGLSTELTLPAQAVVGISVRPIPALELLADYQWTGWEVFDRADIDFENQEADVPLVLDYQNANTFRLGAQYDVTEAVALRGGFIFNTAAEGDYSVSPLLPEAERNYYTVGLGYDFGNGLAIDLGYQLVDQSDREGRVSGRAPGLSEAQLEALNVGVYTADAHVFNVTASYRFGPFGPQR